MEVETLQEADSTSKEIYQLKYALLQNIYFESEQSGGPIRDRSGTV